MSSATNNELPKGSIKDILHYSQSERFAAYALIWYMCSGLIILGMNVLTPEFQGRATLYQIFINLILLILVVLRYITMSKQKKATVWPIYVLALGSVALSMLVNPQYESWFWHKEYGIPIMILPLSSGIWMLLIVGLFTDKDKLLNCLLLAARFLFIYYALLFVRFLQRGYWETMDYTGKVIKNYYSLDFGYNVAFCVMAALYNYTNHKKPVDMAIVIGGCLMMFRGGSRGCFLSLAVFIVLLFIQKFRETKTFSVKFGVICAVVVAGLILLVTGYEWIYTGIITLASKYGGSGRFVEMLLAGTLAGDSGRSEIWKVATDMIKEGGLSGYGFYGDRYVIGKTWYWGYCHNIFLEILIDYGWLIGGALIALLVYNIIRFYLKAKDPAWAMLCILFFSACVKLYFSNSYWYHPYFWGLLGIIELWRKHSGGSKLRIVWR